MYLQSGQNYVPSPTPEAGTDESGGGALASWAWKG